MYFLNDIFFLKKAAKLALSFSQVLNSLDFAYKTYKMFQNSPIRDDILKIKFEKIKLESFNNNLQFKQSFLNLKKREI